MDTTKTEPKPARRVCDSCGQTQGERNLCGQACCPCGKWPSAQPADAVLVALDELQQHILAVEMTEQEAAAENDIERLDEGEELDEADTATSDRLIAISDAARAAHAETGKELAELRAQVSAMRTHGEEIHAELARVSEAGGRLATSYADAISEDCARRSRDGAAACHPRCQHPGDDDHAQDSTCIPQMRRSLIAAYRAARQGKP
jgi:hypothetical protein